MVIGLKGDGRTPPPLTSQGWFFHHGGIYPRNRQSPLCVYSVVLTLNMDTWYRRGIIVCIEYQTVTGVSVPSSKLGPPRERVCLPPWTQRGKVQYFLARGGVGGTQFGRLARKHGTLSTITPCLIQYTLHRCLMIDVLNRRCSSVVGVSFLAANIHWLQIISMYVDQKTKILPNLSEMIKIVKNYTCRWVKFRPSCTIWWGWGGCCSACSSVNKLYSK
jgi:hypothetical protein